jgi:hypothetical protein
MRKILPITLSILLVFIWYLPIGHAQSIYPITSSINVFYNWIPIIMIGIFVSAMIPIVMYALATLINNGRLKQMAIGEFAQVVGTAVIIVIIISALNFYGSAIYQSDTQLAQSVSNICSSAQLGTSPLYLTNSQLQIAGASNPGPTATICSGIINPASSGSSDITTNINYGLAATYAIAANITSQSAININALNIFENWYGTLSALVVTENICYPATCAANPAIAPAGPAVFNATYSYSPFNLYGKIRGGTLLIGSEAQLVTYLGVIELIAIIIMLFGWPYLLAAGIILRSSFMTRRAGGLILSVVIVGLFLYPMLTLFEYAALANANNPLSPIGIPPVIQGANPYNSMLLTGLPIQTSSSSTISPTGEVTVVGQAPIDYDSQFINFYVYPRLDYILNNNGCWPPYGSVTYGEAEVAGSYLIPGVGLILAAKDFLTTLPTFGGIPSPGLTFLGGFSCTPENILTSIFNISNMYGIIFVSSVLLNIMNLLILLSSIKGISSLLGGDTSLLGLGRLL